MAAQAPLAADTPPSPWPTVARVVVLLAVIISVLLTAFAWPSVRSSVHDVPIAVAGPAAAVEQVSTALDQRLPEGFETTEVADTAAAERLIRDREVYGAIDVSSGTPQVIMASAASTAVAQTLQRLATALSQAQAQGTNAAVAVRDLVALPADDPRGAGGLALAAILQYWLGSLNGAYWGNSGAIALTIAATSLSILGLESLLGYVGFGLGAIAMMLVGNPLSGTSTAPEMLPGWSGLLGQLLPPGAGGQLLRSTAFFDGRGATHSVIVLVTWLVFGVVLCLASGLRARRAATVASGLLRTPESPVSTTFATPTN
ncbi:hypothetical protein [Nonomuraea sediminis]|uniref:hypothetical protein n=1 Tax=Nonomuraea sediminis TaxID=2835864 RepID=UPI001BDCF377|nr:hypothetical protein [Nonomuraea sediminis]